MFHQWGRRTEVPLRLVGATYWPDWDLGSCGSEGQLEYTASVSGVFYLWADIAGGRHGNVSWDRWVPIGSRIQVRRAYETLGFEVFARYVDCGEKAVSGAHSAAHGFRSVFVAAHGLVFSRTPWKRLIGGNETEPRQAT